MTLLHRQIVLFSSLFLLTAAPLWAQYNDAGLWLSLAAEKKFTKKLSASASSEWRFNENWAELGAINNDLGVDYKVTKNLRVGAYVRLMSVRQLDNSYLRKHRFYADAAYKVKIRKIQSQLRLRVLSQFKDYKGGDDWSSAAKYLRYKLSFKYDTGKRWMPYCYAEGWTNLDERLFDQYRLSAGVSYEVNKQHGLELGYLINREINVVNPVTDYVVAMGYTFSF